MFCIISFFIYLAPRVGRHLSAPDRYIHLSQKQTIDEHYPSRTIQSEIPPLPMPSMEITPIVLESVASITFDQFSTDAIASIKNSIDTYLIYRYDDLFNKKYI